MPAQLCRPRLLGSAAQREFIMKEAQSISLTPCTALTVKAAGAFCEGMQRTRGIN